MGRETTARVRWQGQEGEAKVLLETAELILRGGIKARIARGSITRATVTSDGLIVCVGDEHLLVRLSEAEASRWAKAIETPPPSLAAKLGLSPEHRAWVLGSADDPALVGALSGAIADRPEGAAMLLAVIEGGPELDQALDLAKAHPALPIWCIYSKGKAADPGDSAVRTAFRAVGWTDNKSCAVSERLTATRYALKR